MILFCVFEGRIESSKRVLPLHSRELFFEGVVLIGEHLGGDRRALSLGGGTQRQWRVYTRAKYEWELRASVAKHQLQKCERKSCRDNSCAEIGLYKCCSTARHLVYACYNIWMPKDIEAPKQGSAHMHTWIWSRRLLMACCCSTCCCDAMKLDTHTHKWR